MYNICKERITYVSQLDSNTKRIIRHALIFYKRCYELKGHC